MNKSEKLKYIKNSGIDLKFLQDGDGLFIKPLDTIILKYNIYYEDEKEYSLFTSNLKGKENPIRINRFVEDGNDMIVGFFIILGCLRKGDAIRAIIPPKLQKNIVNEKYRKLDYKRDVILDLMIIDVNRND